MSNKVTWIPIEQIDDGMFTNEYAVSIRLYDGGIVSLFVDRSLVKEQGGIYHLKVIPIKMETCPDRMKVLLPQETFETSSPWIDVAC